MRKTLMTLSCVALMGCAAAQQSLRDVGLSESQVEIATVLTTDVLCPALNLAVVNSDPILSASVQNVCNRAAQPNAPLSPKEQGEFTINCIETRSLRENAAFPEWKQVCVDEQANAKETLLRMASAIHSVSKSVAPDMDVTVNAYSGAINTNGCGVTSHLVYCDNTVYFDTDLFANYPQTESLVAQWAALHEIAGHGIQDQLGLLSDYRSNQKFRELQAGCFAGFIYKELGADPEQIRTMASFVRNIGDSSTHGTGIERMNIFNKGATEGFEACRSE